MYSGTTSGSGLPLVVVLHGDAPSRKPAYQYTFASELNRRTGASVLALLRPGYADPFGGRSDGDRGLFAVGDNYTQDAQFALANAILEAKQRLGKSRVVLIGHSGGAVLAADIAALHVGLIEKVVLVSCPCDIAAFRNHMARQQWNPLWLLPVRAVSPMRTLPHMGVNTAIAAISGDKDSIAPEEYARDYVKAAQLLHIRQVSFTSLPGQGHEILLNPEVLQLATEELTQ